MDVESLYLRGKEFADRGNYDYAIEIFLDILRVDPRHRNARIALRGCEMENFKLRGGGAAKFKALLKGLSPLIMMHVNTKNPDKVMELCERYLVNDPTQVYVLTKLAESCIRQGYTEAAADTLEFARQRNPLNIKVLRKLGELLNSLGQYDKSVRCFQEILAMNPQDREASERSRQVSAESHLKRSHLEGAQTYRESLRDETGARALEREGRVTRSQEDTLGELNKLKQAAEAAPTDANAWLKLGDECYRGGRYPDAETAYKKSFELSKRYQTREKLGNAHIRLLEQAERKAEQAAIDSNRAPKDMAVHREARQKRLEFCVKEFEFRRKQHPTDMKLAWQLGEFYFELGGEANIQHSIQQFQAAMTSTGLKTRALIMLGRCFSQDPKTLDMARGQFVQALQAIEDPNTEMGKQVQYEIATVDERLGNKAEALAGYKNIFAVDAGYRDVAKKIQELG